MCMYIYLYVMVHVHVCVFPGPLILTSWKKSRQESSLGGRYICID